MAKDDYADILEALQIQMVETQAWAIEQGLKVVIVFEGRDAAGKDGAIKRMTEYMAPRQTRVVALPKPTERETTQWYFQRYAAHLPAAGEIVIFNRSWYNRAGVEAVMGFCTPEQHERFLHDAPHFERMLTQSGVILIKLWLDISRDEQARRLEERVDHPLKRFKVSSLDAEAQARWSAYSAARDEMLKRTHLDYAPWTVVATDQKKTARLNILRHVLRRLDRPGLECREPDPDVVFPGDEAQGRLAE
ncbi:polyphosphate kinase 2 [Brevundimonas diminuta]|uniref:polyphosphate kinase 2 n=1 Tax=Brevundimonas diminuta TaxID=293 RepID=UPI000207EEBF|nr:polyphosphate kinase 2 [Brevundimonas diminuta]EGF96300.1 polyphosphate kinase 2 [Brevundimonas diminuta ATCC 11568]OWR18970.1 polyphosphate kinase 2 [Brevundimonas diminuta]WQE44285.1 polyphosphate kinase 2 [Brevundimonas diminuta]SPU43744.1 polyphosphate kinase 2 [Brevundimonas diminuta]SUW16793.1 polyphosphate kinase 2 [Brevundimonas diminuta]